MSRDVGAGSLACANASVTVAGDPDRRATPQPRIATVCPADATHLVSFLLSDPVSLSRAPSAARLTSSLRDIGYDFVSAIADLIDNSIAALIMTSRRRAVRAR
jgi:hypothetical protein